MKTITQLIIQFSCDNPIDAGTLTQVILDPLERKALGAQNILIKVEQTIHPEA